jgi:hypothetical protein
VHPEEPSVPRQGKPRRQLVVHLLERPRGGQVLAEQRGDAGAVRPEAQLGDRVRGDVQHQRQHVDLAAAGRGQAAREDVDDPVVHRGTGQRGADRPACQHPRRDRRARAGQVGPAGERRQLGQVVPVGGREDLVRDPGILVEHDPVGERENVTVRFVVPAQKCRAVLVVFDDIAAQPVSARAGWAVLTNPGHSP